MPLLWKRGPSSELHQTTRSPVPQVLQETLWVKNEEGEAQQVAFHCNRQEAGLGQFGLFSFTLSSIEVRVARTVRDHDLVQLIRNQQFVGSNPTGGSNTGDSLVAPGDHWSGRLPVIFEAFVHTPLRHGPPRGEPGRLWLNFGCSLQRRVARRVIAARGRRFLTTIISMLRHRDRVMVS